MGDTSGISEATMARTLGNFASLGPATGAKRIDIPSGGNMLPTAVKWIADEIRNDYVAGFQVSPATDKKRHKIESGDAQ